MRTGDIPLCTVWEHWRWYDQHEHRGLPLPYQMTHLFEKCDTHACMDPGVLPLPVSLQLVRGPTPMLVGRLYF